jgi:hypothetical protein
MEFEVASQVCSKKGSQLTLSLLGGSTVQNKKRYKEHWSTGATQLSAAFAAFF